MMLSLFYFHFPFYSFLQTLFPIIPFGIMFSQSTLSAYSLSDSGIMVVIISSYKVSCHKKVNCFLFCNSLPPNLLFLSILELFESADWIASRN